MIPGTLNIRTKERAYAHNRFLHGVAPNPEDLDAAISPTTPEARTRPRHSIAFPAFQLTSVGFRA